MARLTRTGCAQHERRIAMSKKAWSKKDERQYEHVKDSEREQGRSLERAKEIAARTVNKQRRKEGRTKNSGSGSRSK